MLCGRVEEQMALSAFGEAGSLCGPSFNYKTPASRKRGNDPRKCSQKFAIEGRKEISLL